MQRCFRRMYVPHRYQIKNLQACHNFIKQHSFAQVFAWAQGKEPSVVHIPLLLKEEEGKRNGGTLVGHVAAANPISKLFSGESEAKRACAVLATFVGPHGYISPKFYRNEDVPTWNYEIVTVRGHAAKIDSLDTKRKIVDELAAKYEREYFPGQNPWQSNQIKNSDALFAQLRAITAFEINMEEIHFASKLSQKKPAEDFAGVVNGLRSLGGKERENLADAMERSTPEKKS